MLDVFRNSAKGTAGKVIVGLIVITFVLFGAESIISIAGNNAPATVNGEDVSELDYQRLLNSRQQELTNQFGAEVAAQLANSPFLKDEIVETLISQTLQSQLASNLEFDASEEQVLKSFANIPAFQIDGVFNQDQYQNILAANGFNHQSFVAAQKAQTALTQLQAGIADSAFVVDKMVNRYAQLDAQQRTVRYKEFSSSEFIEMVELSDDELNAYYQENEALFMSEEQVKLQYFSVTLESLATDMVVSDNEIQAAYDSYVASLSTQETREISHILFADGDDKQAQAQAALERLANGESFADLATELSDDPGSAEFGGSLGVLLPDVYVSEFYDAAAALQSEGDISEPVETQYGVHLIRLDALDTVQPESLETKRAELIETIKQRKAQDEMILVQSQLSDEAFSTDVLADVAQSFQVDLQQSGWLTRNSDQAPFTEPAVVEAAFAAQVINDGLISDVVRLSNGDLVVMQKLDYAPEAVKPFDEVKDQVVATLTAEKASELMQQELAGIVAEKRVSDDWLTVENITRDNSDVPGEVISIAFATAVGDVNITDGTKTAYAVTVVDLKNPEPDSDSLASAEDFATRASGSLQYQMLYNQARTSAKVTVRR